MQFKINNFESNPLACWGIRENDRLDLKPSEYFCATLSEGELDFLTPILARFEIISFFNMAHSPEKCSKLNDLKWKRNWNEIRGGKESENTSIKIGEFCVNLNCLNIKCLTSVDMLKMLGGVETSFAFLSVDTSPDDIRSALSASVVAKVFASINYPKMLNGIHSKNWFLIRKKNEPTPSLVILSPEKIVIGDVPKA